ncbi:ABC transporter substrate-binding protein [Methylocystis parvus]|uniref:cytochrome c/ABC transporter substrate-binding protein n=1 Tax=Methylocystis parvus TaxID=134 RepID=UPI003C7601DE
MIIGRASQLMRIASCVGLLTSPVAAAPLSELEARGKELYMHGAQQEGPAPEVILGAESAPARLAPCASCHGEDGAGRPEGKINPPDISWSELSNPLGKAYLNGRARPPFSEDDVAQAVLRGLDPAGNRLDPVMPRYKLSQGQLDALVAYLKAIEIDQAPGVTSDAIHVAAIVPTQGAVKDALVAAFSEINARGGVYNRRIDASYLENNDRPQDAAARLDALLQDRSIFAVLALSGAADIFEAAERAHAPLVGAEASSETLRRSGFYLLPSPSAQMRILVDFVARSREGASRAAILFPVDGAADEARRAVTEQSLKRGLPAPIERFYSAEAFDAETSVAALKDGACDTVYFLGDRLAFARFIDAAQALNFHPRLLFSGASIAPALFEASRGFAGKLFFAAAISPDDVLQDAGFAALREKYGLKPHSVASQGLAYAAAQVFALGLKNAGRRLSRPRFSAAIESIQDFNAGVIHRIDFGPRQRVGVRGAHVVEVDLARKRFLQVSEFMAPE